MSDLIDREALLDECLNHYEVGNIEQNCTMDWICKTVRNFPTASPWHRVEEPQKEHGPFLCAAKTKRNGQTHWFFELCWYADGDLRDVVWDAKQESGFYSWNASQDRYIDRTVDYWMPIEPPKEDA